MYAPCLTLHSPPNSPPTFIVVEDITPTHAMLTCKLVIEGVSWFVDSLFSETRRVGSWLAFEFSERRTSSST